MVKRENKSSFKKLPPQIEWAMPLMITFITYVSYHKTGIILAVCITTFAIMVNGWISSKATGDLYSDGLLVVDIVVLCMYLSLTLSLQYSEEKLEPKYFLYSGLLCFSYMAWDIIIKCLISYELWRKVFLPYVYYMGLCGFSHFTLYFLATNNFVNQTYLAIAGMILWLLTLAKWHYDKLHMSKKDE